MKVGLAKGLGSLICILTMPYELGYQMYLTYELAYVRARLVGDHTFEMDLLSWEQGHKDRTRRREAEDGRREARKQGKRGRTKECWEAGKQEAGKRRNRKAGKQGSMEA